MRLKELVHFIHTEHLRRIVVTGPPCSGTTLAAYVLANELESCFIHEDYFGKRDLKGFLEHVSHKSRFVCQGSSLAEYLSWLPEDILIIVMCRPLKDILSWQRWRGYTPPHEQVRVLADLKLFDMEKPIAWILYQYIERIISRTRRVEYLDYDSFVEHPAFLEPDLQKLLIPPQIMLNKKLPMTKTFIKEKCRAR